LPLEARSVVVSGDSLAIGGVENGRTEAWFEVRSDGSVARLGAPPRDAKAMVAAPTPTGRQPYPSPTGYPGTHPVPMPAPTFARTAASAAPEASGAASDREHERDSAGAGP